MLITASLLMMLILIFWQIQNITWITNNTPNREQRESSTCLDHIFIKSKNNDFARMSPIPIASCITDHYTVLLQIVLTHKSNNMIKCKYRYKEQIEENKLIHTIQLVIWDEIFCKPDLNSITDAFLLTLQNCTRNCTKYTIID